MKKQKKPNRQTYTPTQRETARKMYLRGLFLSEISNLLNIPIRTLEKWQLSEKWTLLKAPPEIHKRAYEMNNAGKTYKEIAKILQVSTSSVSRWIKEYRTNVHKS